MSHSQGNPVAKAALIAAMAVGSVLLWLGIPVGWLWVGSMVQSDSQQAGFGPYMLVIFGIVVSAILMAKLLAKLNRVYGTVSGAAPLVKVRMPWHRSMRGEDDSRQPRTMLDVVMVCSVSVALTIFGIWFAFFAGSPLPNS
jgi:F0F1-type ATP synthase membrane subunit c/vacuolar-type H+-ATPase subunit K